jgi:hypothetical protein
MNKFFFALVTIISLTLTASASAADWVVSYPFHAGDSFYSGITINANAAGAIVPCLPNSGGCTFDTNKPRITVVQNADIKETGIEGFNISAPTGAKIAEIYVQVKYKNANNGRIRFAMQGSSGVTEAPSQWAGANEDRTLTRRFSGSFSTLLVGIYREGTSEAPTGSGNQNYLVITNIDVRFRESAAPTVTENVKIPTAFQKGVVCSTLSGTAAGSGMGSLGLVSPGVRVLSEIGAPGTGNRYTPGPPAFGPANLCFNTAELADGKHGIAAFGRSAAGEVRQNGTYTLSVDNNPPTVTEIIQPPVPTRPKFSIKATDGNGSGVAKYSVTLDGKPVDTSDSIAGYSVSNTTSGYTFTWSTSTTKPQIAPGNHTVAYSITDKMGHVRTGSFAFVTPPLPANTVAPTISGPVQVGRVVTCNPGTWTDATSYTYQWLLSGSNSDRTPTKSLRDSDLGKVLVCVVKATGPGGEGEARSVPVQVAKFSNVVTPPAASACSGRIVRSTTVRRMGANTIRIAKVRRGKCVTLTLQKKSGSRYVALRGKRVVMRTGRSTVARTTSTRGKVSARFTSTGSTLRITVLGRSTSIRY